MIVFSIKLPARFGCPLSDWNPPELVIPHWLFWISKSIEGLKDISTPDFSTPSFNPKPFHPRIFKLELSNPGLFNPRLFKCELFNPRLLNTGLSNPNSGVEKSRVGKFMAENSGVEMSSQSRGLKLGFEKSGVEMSSEDRNVHVHGWKVHG